MLDPGDTAKQSRRTHICLCITIDSNYFYIPLRNNLRDDVRPYGRIGHSVPSASRPNAGLDFRYTLVINEQAYIEPQTVLKIPESQYSIIARDFDTICNEFSVYLRGYKRAARKGRLQREPLYRESSLINFHTELGL